MAKYGRDAASEDFPRVSAFRSAIDSAAQRHGVRACQVAAILSRETRGLPKFFIGDEGHGCGPMQVDDRSFPDVCAEYKQGKRTNEEMIDFGARVLREKCMALRLNRHLAGDTAALERAAIAAYNCGEGRVARMLADGRDVDSSTTGANYSSDVLQRAAFFREKGFGN